MKTKTKIFGTALLCCVLVLAFTICAGCTASEDPSNSSIPSPTQVPVDSSSDAPYPTGGPVAVGDHVLDMEGYIWNKSDFSPEDAVFAAKILTETDESKVLDTLDTLDNKYIVIDYNTSNNLLVPMSVMISKFNFSYEAYYGSLAFRLYNLIGTQSLQYGIPALQHFRLVYDNPNYTGEYDSTGNIIKKNTRIFEYVKGAVINGEGTISTTLTFNDGIVVTYEQSSSNGKFVVPYATGSNGGITASPYTIKETGKQITVTESQVKNGEVVE